MSVDTFSVSTSSFTRSNVSLSLKLYLRNPHLLRYSLFFRFCFPDHGENLIVDEEMKIETELTGIFHTSIRGNQNCPEVKYITEAP